ncbi:DUF2768 domain-containing protein [Virgibacillus sp. W0430]|uniref:DUF2768 domain-containing protein n=1 Tax=Virgibacillus sp. W0430 TaxID=3391580 RepID=UPI003F450D4A
MSASGLKEIISFVGIALLILAIVFIQISRRKLNGWIAGVVAILAYICLIIGAVIVFFIVFSGPSS